MKSLHWMQLYLVLPRIFLTQGSAFTTMFILVDLINRRLYIQREKSIAGFCVSCINDDVFLLSDIDTSTSRIDKPLSTISIGGGRGYLIRGYLL